ncbi:unnamed protein product [Schistocephalus solidus]|uniref:3HCDH domain-containing protein n=1 Tax=Schistocephalus solidus TaxID=70667 RepID=A0A183SHR1_SCHSO|nr:unnamed protein product [Schistocephalus solidus]
MIMGNDTLSSLEIDKPHGRSLLIPTIFRRKANFEQGSIDEAVHTMGTIPYLGLFLNDLAMLNESAPDWIPKREAGVPRRPNSSSRCLSRRSSPAMINHSRTSLGSTRAPSPSETASTVSGTTETRRNFPPVYDKRSGRSSRELDSNGEPGLPYRHKREASITSCPGGTATSRSTLRSETPVIMGFRRKNKTSNSCRSNVDKREGQLINFHKHKREYAVLSKLIELQRSAKRFSLVENKDFAAWLRALPLLSEDEAIRRALELEPGSLSPKNMKDSNSSEVIVANNTSNLPILKTAETILKNKASKITMNSAGDMGLHQGKILIFLKGVPGFYTVCILALMLAGVIRLMQKGMTPTEPDAAVQAFGWPVDKDTIADEVGLDVAVRVVDDIQAALVKRVQPHHLHQIYSHQPNLHLLPPHIHVTHQHGRSLANQCQEHQHTPTAPAPTVHSANAHSQITNLTGTTSATPASTSGCSPSESLDSHTSEVSSPSVCSVPTTKLDSGTTTPSISPAYSLAVRSNGRQFSRKFQGRYGGVDLPYQMVRFHPILRAKEITWLTEPATQTGTPLTAFEWTPSERQKFKFRLVAKKVMGFSLGIHQRISRRFLVDKGVQMSDISTTAASRLYPNPGIFLRTVKTSPVAAFGSSSLSLTIGLRRLFSGVFGLADIHCSLRGASLLTAFYLLADCQQPRLHNQTTSFTVYNTLSSVVSSQLFVLDPDSHALEREGRLAGRCLAGADELF